MTPPYLSWCLPSIPFHDILIIIQVSILTKLECIPHYTTQCLSLYGIIHLGSIIIILALKTEGEGTSGGVMRVGK